MSARFWGGVGFQVSAALGIVLLLAFVYAICQRAIPWRRLLVLCGGWLGAITWYTGHPRWHLVQVQQFAGSGGLASTYSRCWGALGTLLVFVRPSRNWLANWPT